MHRSADRSWHDAAVHDGLVLATDRLRIRPMTVRDASTVVGYRNDDDVARFQDWPMPYSLADAERLTRESELLGGPVAGEWVNLAIDVDGRMVGDLAVWIDTSSEFAMIGYTIAADHQGNGFSVGATELMLEWLFDTVGVHRVGATVDPRNVASASVLERCGFQYVGTARSSALQRGEWTDDARFSLLSEDWHAWTTRPTHAPASVELVEVDPDNVRKVSTLELAHSQRRFVTGPAISIAEAAHPPRRGGVSARPWYRAVVADGDVCGFVMIALPTSNQPTTILWRLMVDRLHQRRGIARRVVGMIAELRLAAGEEDLEVSFVDEPGGPERFYRELGFVPTGLVEHGEKWSRAPLTTVVERSRADLDAG